MENNDIIRQASGQLQANDSEYVRLVTHISDLCENAKNKAALAVNTELLDANWQTGQYIVEFEQGGNAKAKYGDRLLVRIGRFFFLMISSSNSLTSLSRSSLIVNPNLWRLSIVLYSFSNLLIIQYIECWDTLSHSL